MAAIEATKISAIVRTITKQGPDQHVRIDFSLMNNDLREFSPEHDLRYAANSAAWRGQKRPAKAAKSAANATIQNGTKPAHTFVGNV